MGIYCKENVDENFFDDSVPLLPDNGNGLVQCYGENSSNSPPIIRTSTPVFPDNFSNNFNHAGQDLKSYLENNSDGRVILLAYKYTNRLTPQHRNMLVHLAICQQRDIAFANSPTPGKLDDFKIKSENFLTIASEIEALFPNEDASVYYIPYKKVGNEQILASGKLFDHFNYIKKCLKDDLILFKKAAKGSEASEVVENSSLTNNELIQQEEWLKSNISPKETVFEYWEKTFQFRRKILLNDNLPVNDYLNRYRALSFEFGCDLIKIDFEKLHPGKSNNFLIEWPILRKKLLHLLQASRLPKQEEHRTLLMNILQLEEKKQDGIILYLLPTLFKPTQIAYKKVKRARISTENCKKKPSSLEIQEAFVLHVENPSDINIAIEKKRGELSACNIPFQPVALFVGPLRNLEAFYVIINDYRFQLPSPVEAIDFAFKIFYSADIQYPIQAFQVWLFLQKVGYSIQHDNDKFGTHLNILISEIKNS